LKKKAMGILQKKCHQERGDQKGDLVRCIMANEWRKPDRPPGGGANWSVFLQKEGIEAVKEGEVKRKSWVGKSLKRRWVEKSQSRKEKIRTQKSLPL